MHAQLNELKTLAEQITDPNDIKALVEKAFLEGVLYEKNNYVQKSKDWITNYNSKKAA